VQYGGITLIVNSMCAHPENHDLIMRSIQTLDNIAMASKEHAEIVIAEGGRDTIQEVVNAYADDEAIVECGNSALLSMTSLENRVVEEVSLLPSRSGKKKAKAAIVTLEDQVADPLKEHRNLLNAGQIMNEWVAGGSTKKHVFITPDWKNLAWKDPRKGAKGGNVIKIRDLLTARAGLGSGHKAKKVAEELLFVIEATSYELCLEAPSKAARDRWIAAIAAVVVAARSQPSALHA
jgi:hypothetical protein